jgi:hypothetical protein
MMEENHHFSISRAFMQIDVQMYLVFSFPFQHTDFIIFFVSGTLP